MTSDTAQSETKPQARPETFRSHLPAVVAATTGTVLAAILGSLIGTAGTIVGMVIGSLASGTLSWWAERGIRRSTALAAARAEALRVRGHHADADENAAATQTAATRAAANQTAPTRAAAPLAAATQTALNQTTPTRAAAPRHRPARLRRRWAIPAMFIAVAFAGCALVVTLVEGAAGKPLSAVVQGKPGHGTTLGGGTVGKRVPASPAPSPSVSATGGTTAPATSTPSPGVSSSPSATVSPDATSTGSAAPATSPPTATATATPTATPAGTATAGTTPTGTATAG